MSPGRRGCPVRQAEEVTAQLPSLLDEPHGGRQGRVRRGAWAREGRSVVWAAASSPHGDRVVASPSGLGDLLTPSRAGREPGRSALLRAEAVFVLEGGEDREAGSPRENGRENHSQASGLARRGPGATLPSVRTETGVRWVHACGAGGGGGRVQSRVAVGAGGRPACDDGCHLQSLLCSPQGGTAVPKATS